MRHDAPRAGGHDQHIVRQAHGFHQVVGDQQHRHAAGGLLLQQQLVQLVAQAHIQGGKRLVHQQQLGRQHQGAGQGHAALHPARKFCRVLRQRQFGQAQRQSHLPRLRVALAFVHALGFQGQGDVVQHRHPGQQARLLEHDRRGGKGLGDAPLLHL